MPYKSKIEKSKFQATYYPEWYRKNGRRRAADYLLKSSEYRKQHRLETNITQRIRYRIKRGIVVRPDCCSICGRGGWIVAHHPDYNEPLAVIWACSSCHKRLHLGENLGGEIFNL